MDRRPIEKLKEILGHSTVQVTERYAHLKTDLFSPADLAAMSIDLTPGEGPHRYRWLRCGYAGGGRPRREVVSI